jgi:glycosyltransferase involved in cell wall biosynthesis
MAHRKIHVACLITDLDTGGAENNLAMLATGLDTRRFTVSVASLMPPGKIGRDLLARGFPVTDIHMTSCTDLRAPARVVEWLRRTRPDILHTWLFHANILGGFSAALARVPVVIWSVRVAEPRRSHLALSALALGLARHVLANSESLRAYLVRRGIDSRKLSVVPNAVDLQRFARPREVNPGKPIVLFIGRLTRQKGVDVLLRAAQALQGRIDVQINIVGEGPDRPDLLQLARDLNLANVKFLGQSDRVPELLASADVLVLPSRWEGMPNVVLEALAARCPVVATNTTGTLDLIRNGENGLLVPVNSYLALADGIELVIKDRLLARSLAKKGYETASGYSPGAMVQAHENLYLTLQAKARIRL